ncbi:hypothetical protein H072_7713 [Dactylellina haptotyla CBS 200.50]|uniref:Sugar phosphate transporter domain-containing protein n=1 Tax=Dactylellina haptotyla (strain CBS 200.50) TaxID=1284197 RepID=S8A6D8_DACHA|nr:hypothetical protein H072_7713 [Dactylellina haptotyla CBS 200.50]
MRRSARIASSNALTSEYTDSDSETPKTPRTPRTPRTPKRRSVSPRKKPRITAATLASADDEHSIATTTGTDLVGTTSDNTVNPAAQESMHYNGNGDSLSNGGVRKSVDSETEKLRSSEEGRRESFENGHARHPSNGTTDVKAIASGALQSTLPEWFSLVAMISLIFGGCCSNVFALEAIVKEAPDSGHLITLAQFIIVSIEGFIAHFDWNSPTLLVKNQIPMVRWLGAIILFFSVSVLNNWAFEYNISVPIHIILRSGGSVTTMLIGACIGKRFSKVQILSVLILTGGIILSAMSNAKTMGESEHSLPRFVTGLSILFVSQILAALMGVYFEQTYAKYGPNWREGLFYTHALSLPLFIPFANAIKLQFYRLYSSEPLPLPTLLPFFPDSLSHIQIPQQLFYLGVNAVTQYVCVRGVNYLAGMSTALTVTIVLNIRKLVSLLLSIWLFGNKLSGGVISGAMVVFLGAFVYGLESQRQGKMRREAAARREKEQKMARAEERKEYTS